MKKILILSLGRTGACVTYATEIINRLGDLPCDTYVSRYCQEKTPQKSNKIITYNNWLQFIINTFFIAPFHLLLITLNLVLGKYDKAFSPYFHYWNIFFILIFKLFHKKVILTVHDGILHTGDGNILEQYLNILCIKLADEIIFLTDYVRVMVQEKIHFKAKHHIIPLGIIIPKGIGKNVRKHNPKPILLFLGRVNKYKGIENLIKAVLAIGNDKYEKLIIAGKFSYKINVEYDLSKIEIIDKFLSDEEIAHVINKADILVMPYNEATQSGVIPIGIAGCIPMVVTNVGGLREQLIDNYEAIFVETNPHSIGAGIMKLIKDPYLYENISINLKNKSEKLSWQDIAVKIKSVLS